MVDNNYLAPLNIFSMEYYKLVAVTGFPGLYELLSSKKGGAIVRSLQDKTTKFASTRVHQFSHLESIEIYTTGENVNLVEVFQAMEKSTETLPNTKDEKDVKSFFQKVYPAMDFDRVYNSDMKKIVKWFEILKENAIVPRLSETTEAGEEEERPVPQNEPTTEKPAKKAVAKKKEVVKKTTSDAANVEETPKAAAKKKAPAKKKAE